MKVPAALLNQRITIEPYLGETAYGPKWGDPLTVRARVEGERRTIRRSDGTDVTSSARATVLPEIVDRLPAGAELPQSKVTYETRTYDVLDVLDGMGLSSAAYRDLILG